MASGETGVIADRVSMEIDEAADEYVRGRMSPREALLFEEFFIGCWKFRRQVIVAIALESVDIDDDDDDLTELDRVARLFAFEESTSEQLSEAQARYDAIAGHTSLPAVDVGKGEVVADQRPSSGLEDVQLIRRYLESSSSSSDYSEFERRAAADARVRALYYTIERLRAWVRSVGG